MKQIQDCLDAMSENRLMLRLWQSGRELFHSNMLAFILEAGEQPKLLSYLWGTDWGDDYPHVRVLREHKHMDLWVIALPKANEFDPDDNEYWNEINRLDSEKIKPWRLIVIENKFKSLPSKQQLKRYDNNLPFCKTKGTGLKKSAQGVRSLRKDWMSRLDTDHVPEPASYAKHWLYEKKCIILMPSVPDEADHMFCEPWETRTWFGIQSNIESHDELIGLEKLFTKEYCRILKNACELHSHHRQIVKKMFSYGDNVRRSAFRLRLHDFVDKWRYEWLAQEIVALFNKSEPCSLKISHGRKEFDGYLLSENDSSCWLLIEPFFSHGTGGVDLCLHIPSSNEEKNPFAMGVQLQGNVLKIFVIQDIATDKYRADDLVSIAKTTAAAVINYLVSKLNEIPGTEFGRVDGSANSLSDLGKYDQTVSLLKWKNENQIENWYIDQPSTKGSFIYRKWIAWDSDSKNDTDGQSNDSACFSKSWGALGVSELAKEIIKILDVLRSNVDAVRKIINNSNNTFNH